MKGDFEKMKGEFEKRIKAFRDNSFRLKTFTDQESTLISNVMNLLVDEARKTLLNCKDYESLRKEVVRWFGNE